MAPAPAADRAAQAKVDRLRRPGGHLRVGGHHEHTRRAALLGAHGGEVHRPGVLLVGILVALHLEHDRQHQRALIVPELEHQVGAELHRDELVEGCLDDGDRGVTREVNVEEDREEMRRERRVLAKHVDESVVLERRHYGKLLT